MVVVEEPGENMLPGCNAACAVSQAVALAAAQLQKIEPFEHIAKLCSVQVRNCLVTQHRQFRSINRYCCLTEAIKYAQKYDW